MLVATKIRIKQGFKNFFGETFRPHGREDYAEFFTRGLNDKKGVNRVYPWMYMRVAVVCAVLFAAFCALSNYTQNSISFPVIVLLGGLFLALPFTVLVYELYPCRDISFCAAVGVIVAGTLFANVIIQVGYAIWSPDFPFLSAAYTAVLEEVGKAIPAIVIIAVLKKRNPFFGFLIGALVGAGISISEDMGYIFAYTFSGFTLSYQLTIGITLLRGITAFFTHIAWTAFIGWAYCKYPKALGNKKFYGMPVLSIVLHFLWDCPVTAVALSVIMCVACSIAAFIVTLVIVRRERKRAFLTVLGDEPVLLPREPLLKSQKCSQIGNITGVICLLLLSVIALGSIYAPVGYDNERIYFSGIDGVREFVQDGKNLVADFDREYDDTYKNYAESFVDGKLVSATQILTGSSGVKYYYLYAFPNPEDDDNTPEDGDLPADDESEVHDYSKPETIWAEQGEEQYYCYRIKLPDDSEEYVFFVNRSVGRVYYDEETAKYAVETDELVFVGQGYLTAIIAASAAVAAAGIAVFTVFKIKSRRYKNAERELPVLQDSEGGDPFGEDL